MNKEAIDKAVLQAKLEIKEQIERFREKVDRATKDPDNFMTMSELEAEWGRLSRETDKIYSNLISKMLATLDTKEVSKLKKASTSRQE